MTLRPDVSGRDEAWSIIVIVVMRRPSREIWFDREGEVPEESQSRERLFAIRALTPMSRKLRNSLFSFSSLEFLRDSCAPLTRSAAWSNACSIPTLSSAARRSYATISPHSRKTSPAINRTPYRRHLYETSIDINDVVSRNVWYKFLFILIFF